MFRSYIEYEGKIFYQCPIYDDSTASAYMFYKHQDILRISNNGAIAYAKVYMLTRDATFAKILQYYFVGCDLEDWNMLGTSPEWYEKLDVYFGALKTR